MDLFSLAMYPGLRSAGLGFRISAKRGIGRTLWKSHSRSNRGESSNYHAPRRGRETKYPLWMPFWLLSLTPELQVRDNTFCNILNKMYDAFTRQQQGYTPFRFSPGRLLLSFSAIGTWFTRLLLPHAVFCSRKKGGGAGCSGQDPKIIRQVRTYSPQRGGRGENNSPYPCSTF